MMTGEWNLPKNILPKPEPFLLQRRAKTYVITEKSGPQHSVPKLPIPRYNNCLPPHSSPDQAKRSPTPVKHKFGIRKIDDDTDAVDGFDDSDDDYVMAEHSQEPEMSSFQPVPLSVTSAYQQITPVVVPKERPILPATMISNKPLVIASKPANNLANIMPFFASNLAVGGTNRAGQILMGNVFTLGQLSAKPNPDGFRPPKKKKFIRIDGESGGTQSSPVSNLLRSYCCFRPYPTKIAF